MSSVTQSCTFLLVADIIVLNGLIIFNIRVAFCKFQLAESKTEFHAEKSKYFVAPGILYSKSSCFLRFSKVIEKDFCFATHIG